MINKISKEIPKAIIEALSIRNKRGNPYNHRHGAEWVLESNEQSEYTDMFAVFHLINRGDLIIGVAGDGNNGSYEWFAKTEKGFKTSDCGYGDTDIALRDALIKFL